MTAPKPIDVRQTAPTSESELFAGTGVMFTPAHELVDALDALAREVAVCRELLELLVDWAGARDRVPPADVGELLASDHMDARPSRELPRDDLS